MQEISLIPYSADLHSIFLEKWLTNKELMHGWGTPIFKIEEITPWTEDPTRVILMVKDEKNGNIVGFVNFYEWNKEKGIASRGTLIDPEFQNQGFGKAAIKESNRYAFEEMKLKKIELYVEADNERSRHVTEKLGYTFERFDPKKQRYYYYMEEK
jgi:RimJ/RimL family protein N-acetyltransferase